MFEILVRPFTQTNPSKENDLDRLNRLEYTQNFQAHILAAIQLFTFQRAS